MQEEVNSIFTEDGKLQAAVALGRLGGSAKSKKKTLAAKRNCLMPCHPGNKKGRPKGSKNKKK